MNKTCTQCGQLLPAEEFYFISRKRDTRRGQCKSCMADIKKAQRDPAWLPTCNGCGQLRPRSGPGRRLCQTCFDAKYEAEPARKKGGHNLRLPPCSACGAKRLRADHVKGASLCPICRSVPQGRRTRLKAYFNMTPREYMDLLTKQGHVCAICGKKPRGAFAIDHRHKSPAIIRGALCTPCNTLLSFARDDVGRLRAAAAYLKNPPAQKLFPGREKSQALGAILGAWTRKSGRH